MENQKMFDELENLVIEPKDFNTSGMLATVEIANVSPASYNVYIYGACEFVYSDGSTYQDNKLGRVYRGSSIIWKSNSDTKCVERINMAIIAKSDTHPGIGRYPLADQAPAGQCIIERGWYFGETKNVKSGAKELQQMFCLEEKK
ncbi:hypothetical protein [Aquimarina algiphila]|uniref:hypothetical protein n=1 Tax=Aquimarina algiphila TaxID=2047982 RepID=UPI00232EE075|nr:hypothetical protein [Aquimarina algiphila]